MFGPNSNYCPFGMKNGVIKNVFLQNIYPHFGSCAIKASNNHYMMHYNLENTLLKKVYTSIWCTKRNYLQQRNRKHYMDQKCTTNRKLTYKTWCKFVCIDHGVSKRPFLENN